MMTVPSRTARLRRILALTLTLLLLGTASAAAYWTAQTEAESRTTAATVGIEQALAQDGGASSLAGVYDETATTLAGIVAIMNTGSREAAPSLTVQVSDAADSVVASTLQIKVALVSDAQHCTPQTELTGASSGTLGTEFSFPADIDPDATVLACVQTSLDPAAVPEGAQFDVELTSSLAYADAAQWIIDADAPLTASQSVDTDPFAGMEQMICVSPGPWEPQLQFSGETGWEAKGNVQYRMFLSHADDPEEKFPFVDGRTTGWDAKVYLSNGGPDLLAFVGSDGGRLGNAWVHVEKKFPNDADWTPVAMGKFHTTPTTAEDVNAMGVYCGWK